MVRDGGNPTSICGLLILSAGIPEPDEKAVANGFRMAWAKTDCLVSDGSLQKKNDVPRARSGGLLQSRRCLT
ncbi:hypothetical protein MPL3365_200166 [Mesorhizobium plurifarium]|uniref:Uncharacterized protein n=1 Tax=Mesorhizobium plurifarium TaxID=69974 RepID=A0A090GA11_MESPL|nr:hypothetical protein MPL3365_200166 [Mesorhizobium plurifarium]